MSEETPGARPAARPVRPARAEKVASRVARAIVRDIVDRGLVPGDGLESETLMLDRFGISRGSLREALRILETQGLISIKPGPGGGPSLAPVDAGDFGRMATLFFQVMGVTLGDVLEARLVIEPMMAGLAAGRRDAEAEAALLANIADHDVGLTSAEWSRVSQEFHALVLGMSGNPLLGLLALSLGDIYSARVAGVSHPGEERVLVAAEHAEISRAVVAGDASAAERLMREYMVGLGERDRSRHAALLDELVDWT